MYMYGTSHALQYIYHCLFKLQNFKTTTPVYVCHWRSWAHNFSSLLQETPKEEKGKKGKDKGKDGSRVNSAKSSIQQVCVLISVSHESTLINFRVHKLYNFRS